MALIPPQNTHGIAIPPAPSDPATLQDITRAKVYADTLSTIRYAYDDDIGAAESYKAAVVSSHSPGGYEVPAKLKDMEYDVELLEIDIVQINRRLQEVENRLKSIEDRLREMPAVLYNVFAGGVGLLRNPTAIDPNGGAPYLTPPNPRTRDELFDFTMDQCILSAANLGLPTLASGANLLDHRRQIAVRLGIPHR